MPARPAGRAASRIHPTHDAGRPFGSRPLVHGDALGAGDLQLGGIAIGELEARAEPHTPSGEIRLGRVEVRDPVDEHRLLTVQVLGEEQLRAIDGESKHRNASVEPFDGEHDLGAEPLDVVRELRGDVGARA
jgi:hypothetical protein